MINHKELQTQWVENGANWLDLEVDPDHISGWEWYQQINLDKLDVTSTETCVLAQIFGNFERASFKHFSQFLRRIMIDAFRHKLDDYPQELIEFLCDVPWCYFGFEVPFGFGDFTWKACGEAWEHEIRGRLERHNAAPVTDGGIVTSGKVIIHMGMEYKPKNKE